MAYVDDIAKDNNGVKYLPVLRDLFDRTAEVKGMKTKDSKEKVCSFSTTIAKKNQTGKIWVVKRRKIAGEFKNLSKAEGLEVYFTMTETKATFAERTLQNPKKLLQRHME